MHMHTMKWAYTGLPACPTTSMGRAQSAATAAPIMLAHLYVAVVEAQCVFGLQRREIPRIEHRMMYVDIYIHMYFISIVAASAFIS